MPKMKSHNMLYVYCKNCNSRIPTGAAISPESHMTLWNNQTQCPNCKQIVPWSEDTVEFVDGTKPGK